MHSLHYGKYSKKNILGLFRFVCLFVFYAISTIVGYLMPNPFLYK